ncbi:arginase [Paenibacillus lignilyticus]|uniref:Arginase n=1 Tax=Paenibacillus lignilyticus TaxID=1172615 RepID=A0ABS5CFA6_9BACL|nr:arginase [Paenibacillus lignilyticus]MBP3964535.1 arginase [Paenibacillus lignilyticus]
MNKYRQPVTVLPVPFHFGASRPGASGGPEAVLQAGLPEKLQLLNQSYSILPWKETAESAIERRTLERLRNWGRVLAMSEALAHSVHAAMENETFPLTIGGDHSIAIGTIAGITERIQQLGVVWIDAHADMNTPETSLTGNIHGMALAASLGLGDSRFTDLLGRSPKLQAKRVVLVGVRELDEGEKRNIYETGITCFTMHDIDRIGMGRVMEKAIAIASYGSEGVHVSFDIDSVDPGEAPGTGTPVRGGLNYREAHLAMEMLFDCGMVTSADIVEVNPLLDTNGRTARLAVELIGSLLGERIL